MSFVLVTSSQDLAGVTMTKCLKDMGFTPDGRHNDERGQSLGCTNPGISLYIANSSLLTLESLDSVYPDAKAFVFLSKHRSDSGIPTLTCHCTGNFNSAPFGGNPKEIAISYSSLQKAYLKAVSSAQAPGYDVIIEATHHGPTSLKKPVLFVELGSSEKQWADYAAAQVICDAVLQAIDNIEPCKKVGVAIGGTHYPTKFNKLLLESEFGLAAVASKHNLDSIDENMLAQMIEKSVEKVTHIILDSKGLGSHKDRILKLVEKTGLQILKL